MRPPKYDITKKLREKGIDYTNIKEKLGITTQAFNLILNKKNKMTLPVGVELVRLGVVNSLSELVELN